MLLLCLLLFFTRLGDSKLWDRDEPRNARCAVEMLERGDWVVPTFNDKLRTHKPVLLYWLMISAYSVFGQNEFAARFWSATLSTGTVLVTYFLGQRLFDTQSAVWASLVLSSTLLFNAAARAATPDASLIFFSTLAITLLASAKINSTTALHRSWCWISAGYAAMGMAVLTKGPIGFVLPMVVWGSYQWWTQPVEARIRLTPNVDMSWLNPRVVWQRFISSVHPPFLWRVVRCMHFPMGILIVILIAGPWYASVGIKTDGQWLREFFLEHNVGRAMRPMEGHRGSVLLYYPVAILVGFFPWSVLAVPLVIWTFQHCRRKTSHEFCLLLLWIGVYVTVFSLARTKLPSYVTPVYPAIAILCGHMIAHWSTAEGFGPRLEWTRWAAACMMVIGLIMLIALPLVLHQWLPGDEWLGLVGLIPFLGGGWCLTSFCRRRWDQGFRRQAFTSIAFLLTLSAVVAPRVSRHQRIESLINPTAFATPQPLASLGIHEPSWVFYAQRPIAFVQPDETRRLHDFLSLPNAGLITSATLYAQVQGQLPNGVEVLATEPYFLKNDRLVLLGTRP